jgi:hypothetical protein
MNLEEKQQIKTRAEYPLCSNGHAMVWTFAFDYNEYACLPCKEVAPMFNGRRKAERSIAYMDAKKSRWSDDLHRLGTGKCIAKSKGKICKVCDTQDYKFKFWGQKLSPQEVKGKEGGGL